jgi:hypothetical protein
MQGLCVICGSTLTKDEAKTSDRITCDCPLCGAYELSGTAEATIPHISTTDDEKATILSYAIRKMQSGSRRPFLDDNVVKQIISTTKLPPQWNKPTN